MNVVFRPPFPIPSGTTSLHKLPPGHSTSTGERESRPFHEKPWHTALCFLLIHALHALCTADIHPLFMVRSLQLVEVRPYAEEEEEDHILTKNENHLTMQQRTI